LVSRELRSKVNQEYFSNENNLENLKGKSVKNGLVSFYVQAAKFGLYMISNIVLARFLEPSDYGLLGMVLSVIGFMTLFRDMGLSSATIQKSSISHEQASTVFWLNVFISLFITLTTVAISPFISYFYGEPRLTSLTCCLSLSIILGGLGTQHSALLQRKMYIRSLVLMDLLSLMIGTIAGVYSASVGIGYWALAIYPIATTTVNTLGLWIVCRWRPGLPKWDVETYSMLKFGGNITGFNILNYFSRNLDNILIGKFWGNQSLGLYAKAYQTTLIPLTQINMSISTFSIPLLSRLVEDPERYRATYLRLLKLISLLTTPIMVCFITTSDLVIKLLLGEKWLAMSSLLIWLSFTGIFQPVASSVGWLFITQNRTKELLYWGIITGTITIASFVIGLPWNAIGVAIAYSLSMTFIVIPTLFWYIGRKGPISQIDFYSAIYPSITSAIITLPSIKYLRLIYSNVSVNIGIECISIVLMIFVLFLGILLVFPSERRFLSELYTAIQEGF
jgi:O-antigen/teichoic acid export membrane protein